MIVIISITLTGLVVVTQVKKIIVSKLTKQHEKVGRILFRVTAGLIALLISLSYANERMEQYKLVDSIESEAALIVNATIKLKMLPAKEALDIRKNLINYVNATIDNHWGFVKTNPFFSNSSEFLREIMNLVYEIPVTTQKEEKIKNDIIGEINQITKLMQVRIYSLNSFTPYLIYILFVGLFFMWIFFTVYKLDFVSLTFLSLYNIFVSILIYFIFLLSNPLFGPLKMEPHAFSIIKTKCFDIQNN